MNVSGVGALSRWPTLTRSDVSVCGHSTRPGTHPLLPGGRPVRPSICARSSSRKRAQSARRSSETNSPGSSDSGPGALSGCCLGSRIHFPRPVETVGNSCVNRRRCAPRALKRLRRGATLRGCVRPANPPNVRADQTYGGARSNSAVRMIFVSRGAALGPCGWPNAAGRRGERPVPRLYSLLAGDRQGSSGSMIRSAQTAQFFPAVRGRSVGAHH